MLAHELTQVTREPSADRFREGRVGLHEVRREKLGVFLELDARVREVAVFLKQRKRRSRKGGSWFGETNEDGLMIGAAFDIARDKPCVSYLRDEFVLTNDTTFTDFFGDDCELTRESADGFWSRVFVFLLLVARSFGRLLVLRSASAELFAPSVDLGKRSLIDLARDHKDEPSHDGSNDPQPVHGARA